MINILSFSLYLSLPFSIRFEWLKQLLSQTKQKGKCRKTFTKFHALLLQWLYTSLTYPTHWRVFLTAGFFPFFSIVTIDYAPCLTFFTIRLTSFQFAGTIALLTEQTQYWKLLEQNHLHQSLLHHKQAAQLKSSHVHSSIAWRLRKERAPTKTPTAIMTYSRWYDIVIEHSTILMVSFKIKIKIIYCIYWKKWNTDFYVIKRFKLKYVSWKQIFSLQLT